MASRPVVEGLFVETREGPRLVGSRCVTCGTPYFPRGARCHNPACGSPRVEEAHFGPHGTLWSLAIQDYPPPAPARYDEPYRSYAAGIVDLDDGLRVLGRLAVDDPRSIEPGQRVELVLGPLYHEADGTAVIGWQFRPV